MARKKDPAVATLDRALKRRAAEGSIYDKLEGGKVRWYSCGHPRGIPDGFDGICRVRFNQRGTLYVPRGSVAGVQLGSIEPERTVPAFPRACGPRVGHVA